MDEKAELLKVVALLKEENAVLRRIVETQRTSLETAKMIIEGHKQAAAMQAEIARLRGM